VELARRQALPQPDARCGDGVVQLSIGEVCDGRNMKDGEVFGRLHDEGPGCVCTRASCASARSSSAQCASKGSNSADDGNTVSGDGCSSDCKTVETGFQCRVVGKACTAKCGTQVLKGEQCDERQHHEWRWLLQHLPDRARR